MVDPVSAPVGTKIRERREASGHSQAEFAAMLGFDRNFLGRVERGLQNLTLATCARLANKLGFSVAELLADVPSDDHTIAELDALSRRRPQQTPESSAAKPAKP